MYALRSRYWIIRDADEERLTRLTFHIEQGDYFPFLATVIGMLGETASRCGPAGMAQEQARFAEEMRKDLLHLHEHYTIAPRKVRLAYTKRKMVRFDA
ncbi:MAG TPA: hypothetical protein VEA36_00040 [Candidatus Paceibacterota bacterium]|nr:hypothetical protein [Candidatus Paceibacterota bacterium]